MFFYVLPNFRNWIFAIFLKWTEFLLSSWNEQSLSWAGRVPPCLSDNKIYLECSSCQSYFFYSKNLKLKLSASTNCLIKNCQMFKTLGKIRVVYSFMKLNCMLVKHNLFRGTFLMNFMDNWSCIMLFSLLKIRIEQLDGLLSKWTEWLYWNVLYLL